MSMVLVRVVGASEGRRSNIIGSGGVSLERDSGSPAIACERLGTFHVDFEEAKKDSSLKLELGVPSPSPWAYDTF